MKFSLLIEWCRRQDNVNSEYGSSAALLPYSLVTLSLLVPLKNSLKNRFRAGQSTKRGINFPIYEYYAWAALLINFLSHGLYFSVSLDLTFRKTL